MWYINQCGTGYENDVNKDDDYDFVLLSEPYDDTSFNGDRDNKAKVYLLKKETWDVHKHDTTADTYCFS